MKPKIIVPIVLLVILASIFATRSVLAQTSQVTSTVSLSHLNVQLTYPSQVLPGQAVTINLTAQAKDNFQLTSLTVQVYLADQSNLRQLLSTTVTQNTVMTSGNQINKQIQVTVPSDSPRTSLVALVTESIGLTSNSYAYGNPYWNGYNNWYGASYPYYYYSNPSIYYGSYYFGSYLSSNYQSSSDNAIAPLSYVLATTPEYAALQSQYQQLQAQNQQFQTQNQQLLQQLQALQNSTAQKDSTINNLNNQLFSARATTTLVGIVAVVLAIAVVALAALHFKPTKPAATESPPPAKTEEKTTGV